MMKKDAFSLVEVSLALLVVAVGILAVLGLFPAGLDQGMRAEAETHAALFAEEVFAGMRAIADENFDSLTNPVPAAAASVPDGWNPDRLQEITVTGTNIVTNIYERAGVIQHAFRYNLNVTNVNVENSVRSATLKVWPGEFGPTNYPMVFYTEFYRFK